MKKSTIGQFLALLLLLSATVTAEGIACRVKLKEGKPQLFLYKNSWETGGEKLVQGGLLTGCLQLTGGKSLAVVWAAIRTESLVLVGRIFATGKGDWQIEIPLSVAETAILAGAFRQQHALLQAWIVYGEYREAQAHNAKIHWKNLLALLGKNNPHTVAQLETALRKALAKKAVTIEPATTVTIEHMLYYVRREIYDYALEEGTVQLRRRFGKRPSGTFEGEFSGPLYGEKQIMVTIEIPHAEQLRHQIYENSLDTSQGTRLQRVQFYTPLNLSRLGISRILLLTELHTPGKTIPGHIVMIDREREIKGTVFTAVNPAQCKLFYHGRVIKQDRTQVKIPKTRIDSPPYNFSVPVHTVSLGNEIIDLIYPEEEDDE